MSAEGSACRRTLVKICGLMTAEAALAAARHGADLAGFVFAPSRRRVTADEVAAILAALGPEAGVQAAGVFVNPEAAELDRVMAVARLDVIQLHGDETPSFCGGVKARFPGTRIIKALAAHAGADDAHHGTGGPSAKEHLMPYAGTVDAFLLDTPGGGTGRRFAWDVIPGYAAAARELGVPLFVAGGLDPGNVTDLVGRYGPDGVDVSSGVETDGAKDPAKIAAFLERVRDIDQKRA